jgi:SMI1 / KNR4 family (SUKH-1)
VLSKNAFARLEEHLVALYGPTQAAFDLPEGWFRRLLRRRRAQPATRATIRAPASAGDLAGFEQRFEVMLPDDVIDCYQHMNGSDDYTHQSAGWLRFWPIEEWKPVWEELPAAPFVWDEPLSESFACADHGISAWFFAIDLDPTRLGRIYSLVPHASVIVSFSFSEFVEKALERPDELFRY